MTEADIATAVAMIRQRLSDYNLYYIEMPLMNQTHTWPTVDGVKAFLYCSYGSPTEYKTYPIDESLTLGQFIDTLDVTLKMLYGPANSVSSYTSSGVVNIGAHSHTFAAGQVVLNKAPQQGYLIPGNLTLRPTYRSPSWKEWLRNKLS